MLDDTLRSLIDSMDTLADAGLIPWASPIPFFGRIREACVATVGINPSKKEFLDESGQELDGENERRFQTLHSLGLDSWSNATDEHLEKILDFCTRYFVRDPYMKWFGPLDEVVSGAGASFRHAQKLCLSCHLDLVPYATDPTWSKLSEDRRARLLRTSCSSLGLLLRDSTIRLVILNGRTVVRHFEAEYKVDLTETDLPDACSLPRESGRHVRGIGYVGKCSRPAGIELEREVLILGYNHNLQSSWGVSHNVIEALKAWVAANSANLRCR